MTDNTSQPELYQSSLDGKALLPPAKLGGNDDIPAPWNKFFTSHDDYGFYMTYNHQRYHYETVNQFLARDERFFKLAALIDQQYVLNYYETKLAEIKERKKAQQKPNRYELGAREFTLTYSPKWFDDTEARLKMATAIQKLCRSYKNDIIQLRAVGEVGTSGLSHIHCFYKLRNGLKITDKNFKRAWPMWNTHVKQGPTGHQGGHHATVRNEADFQGYIDKDIENAWFEVNIDNSTADPN